MIDFQTYLIEAKSVASEDKLTHLEHAEDHPLNAGAKGFEHAKKTLNGVHNAMTGKKSSVSVSTKYDGSPSIVFGHHPETGKFFVASKSAFNKTPKINYTQADIEANHGHAPGLVSKLSAALKHLPKVTPSSGVFQGDIMHSGGGKGGDIRQHGGQSHFTPNTITYSTKKSGEGEAAAASKIGVAVHTAYHGPSFEKLKASYNAGHAGFKEHKDVHLMDVTHEVGKSKYTPEQQAEYKGHMEKAQKAHDELSDGGYSAVEPHSDHLKTYINKTVRTGEKPSVEGYQSHVAEFFDKAASKVKTQGSKAKLATQAAQMNTHIETNKQHFQKAFELHNHLQNAKNVLVRSLASHTTYGHTIGNKSTKPEGFVAVSGNRPTKLVDRAEFSAANFAKNAK